MGNKVESAVLDEMLDIEDVAAEVGTEFAPDVQPANGALAATKNLTLRPKKRQMAIYIEVMEGKDSVRTIAKKWGLRIQRVQAIVHQVDTWLNGNLAKQVDQLKQDIDIQLRQISTKAQNSFEKSTKRKKTIKRKSGVSGENTVDTEETIIEQQVGDPRFLTAELSAAKQRSDLWGLNAPKKTAFTNVDGDGPAEFKMRLDKLSREELLLLRQANRLVLRTKDESIDAEYTVKEQAHDDGAGSTVESGPDVLSGSGDGDEGSGGNADPRSPGSIGDEAPQRSDDPGAVPLCEAELAVWF